MILDSDDSDSSAGKIVHKKYISFRQLTKKDGGGGGGGILIFRLQKFGEKLPFSFSSMLGQKNIRLYQQTFILTGFEALGRLIQFTTVHKLQDVSDHCT